MIREKIVLIFCLVLVMVSQLCFADEADEIEIAPASQGEVLPTEESHEQAASEVVMVEQSDQSYKQAAPEAVTVSQSEEPREQAAPETVMVKLSATALPVRMEVSPSIVIRQEYPSQETKAVPVAVMTTGSEFAEKALPPMSVVVSGAKGAGPQSMKTISVEAVQAVQKK